MFINWIQNKKMKGENNVMTWTFWSDSNHFRSIIFPALPTFPLRNNNSHTKGSQLQVGIDSVAKTFEWRLSLNYEGDQADIFQFRFHLWFIELSIHSYYKVYYVLPRRTTGIKQKNNYRIKKHYTLMNLHSNHY